MNGQVHIHTDCIVCCVHAQAHEDSLYRVLRTAGQLGLVREEAGDDEASADMYNVRGGRRFVLTPMGEVLKVGVG